MAIINVLKYDGPTSVLVWKWQDESNDKREAELRLGTQLVVNESQEAIFYKGGKALDVFGPGTHTLSTQNIPLLANVIGMAFGGDSPFTAEVWFVNKATSMDVKWGLTPFNVIEPNFRVPVPVTARGSFALKVADSRNFLTEIVGTEKEMSSKTLQQKFRGLIGNQVKTAIFKVVQEQKLSPVELEGIVYQVSEAIRGIVGQNLERYGLLLDLFVVEAIPIIDSDPRVKQIIDQLQQIWAEDMQERMRLKRRAENLSVYSTERMYDTTETAAANLGGGGEGGGVAGNILGTFVGIGAASSLGGHIGGMMGGAANAAFWPQGGPPQGGPSGSGVIMCPVCSAPSQSGATFCASCGARISGDAAAGEFVKCSQCGQSSPAGSSHCTGCGKEFNICDECGKDNPPGTKFCIHCGTSTVRSCPNCGAELTGRGKFCPNCGQAIQ